jgi:hypothetical protein
MKQTLLLITILISSYVNAQNLTSIKPDRINPVDSSTHILVFKNAHFTRYQNPYLLIKSIYTEAKIMNDSTLQFTIPPFTSPLSDTSYDVKISCSDASWNPVMLNYPNLLKRKNPELTYLIVDSTYQFQAIPSSILFKIKGRNSHFLSGENTIKIKPKNAVTSAYTANSISIVNDSLLYAQLITNNRFEKGEYVFSLFNSFDGILNDKAPKQIGINPFKLNITKNFISQKGDSIIFKISYTDLIGASKLPFGDSNEISIYNDGLANPVSKISSFTYVKDSTSTVITHTLTFRMALPTKMKTGLIDVSFKNNISGFFWYRNAFSVFHDKPYIAGNMKSMPGKNFQFYFSFLDSKNLPDSVSVIMLKNGIATNEAFIDSFDNLGAGYWQVFGHTTNTAKGQYNCRIITKEDNYNYDGFLTVSEYFPFSFKLSPSHFFNYEDTVSLYVQSEYYGIFDYINTLNNYQFEKNGQVIQGMILQVSTTDPTHNFKIILPKGLAKGWYDLKYYNNSKQAYKLQKNACYVYGDAKGYAINKSKIASNGVGPIKIQMKFEGTHFTQANEAYMNFNNDVKILNDTLVEFPFSAPENSLPGYMSFTSSNDYDGYIPCFPMIEVSTYPKIVELNPKSGKAGDTISILVHAEMTTFTQFPTDITPTFRVFDQIQSKMNILEKEILNDTLMRLKVAIASDMPNVFCYFGITQVNKFAYYQLANAFQVINPGLSLNEVATKSTEAKVYPNPSKGYTFVDNTQSKFTSYKIYDLKGSLIHNGILVSDLNELNLSEILQKNQLYLIELIGEKSVYQRLLIE